MTPDQAKQIRARMRKRFATISQSMALVREADDERFPAEFQAKRGIERDALVREWRMVESQEAEAFNVWAVEGLREAERLRNSIPVGDAAHESRRVADNLEIARLAEPLIGQGPTAVRNHLLSQARRFLSLDLPDRAHVYLEAAKRAGVEDPTLSQALEDAYDRTVPERRQAKAIVQVVQDQRDLFNLDRYAARITHRIGSREELSLASTGIKMEASRRGIPMPVGDVTPATLPSIPGASD